MTVKNKNAIPQTTMVDGRAVIDVFEWQAYKMKETEFMIGGFYRGQDKNIRVVITDVIRGIDAPLRLVETNDGRWYRLNNVASPARKMDLMYEITQWATNNIRRAPMDATNIIEQHLNVETPPQPTSMPEPIVLTEDDVVVDTATEVESTVEVMEGKPVNETVHVVVEDAPTPVKKKRKQRADKGKPRPQMRKENR